MLLKWAVIFFVIALIAAALGFSGIAAGAAGIAKILFYLFLGIFFVLLIAGIIVGRRVVPSTPFILWRLYTLPIYVMGSGTVGGREKTNCLLFGHGVRH